MRVLGSNGTSVITSTSADANATLSHHRDDNGNPAAFALPLVGGTTDTSYACAYAGCVALSWFNSAILHYWYALTER